MDDIFIIGDELTLSKKILDSTFLELKKRGNKIKTFNELEKENGIIASNVPIFMCFPYSLWNKIVEKEDVLYGVGSFGKSIKKLAEYLTEKLEITFPNAKYVNHPMSILKERDKISTKKILMEQGINVAQDVEKSIDAVLNEIEKGNTIYVKARYGSMGKGISYFSKEKWTTNYVYDKHKICNHQNDKNWIEKDITGNLDFLARILEEDVVVERGVKNCLTNGFKFDMRNYAIFGKSYSKFSYGRATNTHSITNLSQRGAKKLTLQEMQTFVPKQQLEKAQEIIVKSAEILGFNYAGGDMLFEGDKYKPIFLEINSFPSPLRVQIPIFFDNLNRVIKKNLLKTSHTLKHNIELHKRYDNKLSYDLPRISL